MLKCLLEKRYGLLNSEEQALYGKECHWRAQRGSAEGPAVLVEIKQVKQSGGA